VKRAAGVGAEESARGPRVRDRVALLCTVRGCGQPLVLGERAAGCARGHGFDRSRLGYWNLLQPQDRRSACPGDSLAAVAARRRWVEAGYDAPLLAAVRALVVDLLSSGARPAVLDVGCGEGSQLTALLAARPIEAHGLDLSRPAIELAARRAPDATWVIANADRFLPYADGSFAAVLSLTARRPVAEMRRVLAATGWLVVAVPAADDLVELRAAVQGEGRLADRWQRVANEMDGSFVLHARQRLEWSARLDQAALQDLLASTYRGARASERWRLGMLANLEVTLSRELAVFRLAPGEP
jgi:23S rRNA (guanine745-N1)-methyltransferase